MKMNTKNIFFIFSVSLSVSLISARGSPSHQDSVQEINRHYHHQEKQSHHIKEKHHLHHQEKLHHPSNKHFETQHVNHRNHIQHLIYRDQNQTCSWVCPGNGTNNNPTTNSSELQVAYNGSAGLIGIASRSENIGLIIGYSSNLSALLNGQSGSAIIFDISSLSIYRINSSQSGNVTWLASRQSFESYVQNVSSLQPLLQQGQKSGEKIGFQNISQPLLAEIGRELGTLGASISPLNILNQIAQLAPQLNGTLRIFFRGNGTFVINRNLQWILSVSSALANIFGNANGNLNFHLNLASLFGARSGIETLLNLLSQIGQQFNLTNVFSVFLRIPLTFVRLFIAGFRTGADLFITAALTIVRFISGGIGTFTEIINSILNFAYSPDINNFDFGQIVSQALKIIENQNRLFNNSADLSNIQKVLEGLNNNNLIVNNVNVTNILSLLRRINPVDIVSTIFKIISQFSPTRIIPQIIQSFLGSSNVTGAIEQLAKLLPGVDLRNLTFGNLSSILQGALRNSNLSQILENLNLTQLFSGTNIFNTIQTLLRNTNLPQIFPGFNLTSSNYLQAIQSILTNSNITQFLQGLNLNNLTSTDFPNILQRLLPNSNLSVLFPGVNFSSIASLSPLQFFESLLHNINLNQLFSDYPNFFSFLARIPSIIVGGIRRFISWAQSLNPLETIPNIIGGGLGAIIGNITNIPAVIGSGINQVLGPVFEPIGPILGPILQTLPGANTTSGPTSSPSEDTETTTTATTVSNEGSFGISGVVDGYLQLLGKKGKAHEAKHPSEKKSDNKFHHHNSQEKHHKREENHHKREEKHHKLEGKHHRREEKHHKHEGKHQRHHSVNENLQ